jgi:hypothetical protein
VIEHIPGRRLPPTVRTATLTGMARPEMHADEIHTDAELIHRLMIGQFPQSADLPVALVPSEGTDHDI